MKPRRPTAVLTLAAVAMAVSVCAQEVRPLELPEAWTLVPPGTPRPVVLAVPSALDDPLERLEVKRVALELRAGGRTVLLRWAGGDRGPLVEIAPYVDGVLAREAQAGLPLPLWLETGSDAPDLVAGAFAGGARAVVVPTGPWAERLGVLYGRSPAPDPAASGVTCRPGGGPAPEVLVREEDLATVVAMPRGSACAEVGLPSSWYEAATLDDGVAERSVPLRRTGDGATVELPEVAGPAVLVVSRPQGTEGMFEGVAEVRAEALPSVEEVIARHQLWATRSGRAARFWSAHNRTLLRVRLPDLDRTVEIGLAGPYLTGGEVAEPEWVWEEVEIDGVAWDPQRVPDLPILQPERLAAVPLHLEPVSLYRYGLEGREERAGRRAFKLRFSPRSGERAGAVGVAWIDCATFALVEVRWVRSGLPGDVVAEERTVRYAAVGDPDDAATPWLPAEIEAFLRLSAFGGQLTVEQRTRLSGFELEPVDLEERRRRAYASALRMVRETADGAVELLPDGQGSRVLASGPDTDQLFLVGGVLAADGLDYPLPLGGLEYHDFDFGGRGRQLRAFFAGVLGDVTLSDPDLLGPGVGVSASLRGQALRFPDQVYVDGEEDEGQRVQSRDQVLEVKVSAAPAAWLRLGLELAVGAVDFAAADDTAPDFVRPHDTVESRARLWLAGSRGPLQLAGWYEARHRQGWEPWGPDGAAGFDPATAEPVRYGAGLTWDRALGPFLSARLGAGWASGEELDRFSALDLASLRGLRVAGVAPGRFRAQELAWAGAAVSTRVLASLRGELRVDHVRLDDLDPAAGRYGLTAVLLGGRVPGPWGTLVSVELASTLGQPGPASWSALVLFLKPL